METSTKHTKILFYMKLLLLACVALLQFFMFLYSTVIFNEYVSSTINVMGLISIFVAIYIISTNHKTSYKISWIFFILILPSSGIFFYLIFGKERFAKKLRNKIIQTRKDREHLLVQNDDVFNEITDLDAKSQALLINRIAGYPVYKNTSSKYLSIGEKYFEELKIELKKAEKFIFLEYFIVSSGKMHNEIMEILIKKSNEGVDVRYLYDSAGSAVVLPHDFRSLCASNNIKCVPFNSFAGNIYSYASYRSHRKITVIDGNVGFTGGINIGDEYINEYEKLGHWKDMGVKLTGDAVWSLTVMFLDGYKIATGEEVDYELYKPTISVTDATGFVAPFDDAPLDQQNPAELNYMKIISTAKKYIYITTPYLVIDSEVTSALKLAAHSGVDVRILTPHIPDKKSVFAVTQSNYSELVLGGVKVYEYTPGFVHGKIIVTDDNVSFVGSINFDFRSLAWNYECGAWVNDHDFAVSVKEDYLKTLEVSEEILMEKWSNRPKLFKIYQALLKIFSPLL